MTQCAKNQRLSAYLDGEMSLQEAAAIRAHLPQCPPCQATLNQLKTATSWLRGPALPPLSPHAIRRLHGGVEAWSCRGPERLAGVLSALAACLAVVSALSLMRTVHQAPPPQQWEISATVPTTDDAAITNTREIAVAEWMVADLSNEGQP